MIYRCLTAMLVGVMVATAGICQVPSTGQPGASAAPAQQLPSADEIFSQFKACVGQLQQYQVIITSRNMVNGKEEFHRIKLIWKSPHLVRVDVLEGPKKGNAAVIDEDGEFHGRTGAAGGALSWLWIDMEPDDERLYNSHGSRFDYGLWQYAIKDIEETLARPDAHWGEVVAETTSVEGQQKQCYQLPIIYPGPNGEQHWEKIWIQQQGLFPIVKWAIYNGENKKILTTYTSFDTTTPVDEDIFDK